ncbi:MAG TPA: fibronectin type III domain-containing protein [Gemmatimonadales bacterium]|jgi:hypothetical protein|nr:fibronectin type III domain-containing protein [Gemmatimonadales bacterium]
MLVVRICLGSLLLVLFVLGCDRSAPLEPTIQAASAAGAGSTPTAPSGTNAVAVSQSRIDVSWRDNSSNETGFEVHRSTLPPSTFALLHSTASGITSYADLGLTPSTDYCYKVRSYRTTGNKTSYSSFSGTVCARTLAPPPPPPPPPPPGPPNAPSAVDAAPAWSTGITVTWGDNSTNEEGFRIERSLDGGASWTTTAIGAANATSFTDDGRASETEVCYRLVAFNADGDSPPSNTDCTAPPVGPTDLSLDAQGALSWTDNSAIEDGYEVWLMDFYGVAYDGRDATLPADATSFSGGSCPAVAWCWGYAVVAVKDGGYSDWAVVWTRNP